MKVTITGASGLLGANLAAAIAEHGSHAITCTKRQSSAVDHLSHLPLEWVVAELSDTGALTRAFDGADWVFHCAASTSIRASVRPVHIAANIEGTRNVLDAAEAAGVGRLVHTSSVVATALSTDGMPVDESARWNFADLGLGDGYATSKKRSEEMVLERAAADLDATVVNPSFMFGPYDAKLSSGRMVLAVAKRKLPGFTAGMGNYVNASDVARGMIGAAEKGRRGERYILGHENLNYQDVFERIAAQAGVKPPRRKIPRALANIGGLLGDAKQWLTGKDSDLNSITVAYGYQTGNVYSSDKAARELDYQPRPIDDGIAAALDWFRSQGLL